MEEDLEQELIGTRNQLIELLSMVDSKLLQLMPEQVILTNHHILQVNKMQNTLGWN